MDFPRADINQQSRPDTNGDETPRHDLEPDFDKPILSVDLFG
jgi:hypothetical protein